MREKKLYIHGIIYLDLIFNDFYSFLKKKHLKNKYFNYDEEVYHEKIVLKFFIRIIKISTEINRNILQ